MTHFRFRYKQVGYVRWRGRMAGRRAVLLVVPLAGAARFAPATAAWRRTLPTCTPVPPPPPVFKIGDFVVGEDGDPQLLGHPDIRY